MTDPNTESAPSPPQPSVARRMGMAALIVSGGVLLSRVLGFVREMVFAAVLGASPTSDEYFVAFIIPDFLNYLLAGAFLSITFIPIFTRYLAAGDEDGAWEAFTAVIRPMALGMTVLVLAAMLLAPYVITLIEPGFDSVQVARATRLTRIVLPAQIFFVTGSLLMAVQYTREQFLIPTLAPIIYNLGIITGGLLLGYVGGLQVDGFAWGVLAGAFVGNFLIQVWGARRAGMRLVGGLSFVHPALKEYILLAIPLMVGQSVVILDEQLGRTFGSLAGDGAISWLNYARRVMLVPAGIIAQAAGVAAYPFLSRLAEEGKIGELARTLAQPLRYVVFLSVPAAVSLGVLAEPAIRILFQRGEFTSADSHATAAALVFYALAVPVWGVLQVVTRGFYARRQMWTPVVIGTVGTLVALPVYYGLLRLMGHTGLALASAVSLSVYTTVLTVVWAARTGWSALRPVLASFLRALPSAGAAGAAGWAAAGAVTGWVDTGTTAGALLQLAVGGAALGSTFLIIAAILRAPELTDVVDRVRRRLRRS